VTRGIWDEIREDLTVLGFTWSKGILSWVEVPPPCTETITKSCFLFLNYPTVIVQLSGTVPISLWFCFIPEPDFTTPILSCNRNVLYSFSAFA
jgi:hypothetical protein